MTAAIDRPGMPTTAPIETVGITERSNGGPTPTDQRTVPVECCIRALLSVHELAEGVVER